MQRAALPHLLASSWTPAQVCLSQRPLRPLCASLPHLARNTVDRQGPCALARRSADGVCLHQCSGRRALDVTVSVGGTVALLGTDWYASGVVAAAELS